MSTKKMFKRFDEAKDFARLLKLKSVKEWRNYCKGKYKEGKGMRPSDVPATPNIIYKDNGWKNWADWLGSSYWSNYESFEKARDYIRDLSLKNLAEWRKYCKGELSDKGKRPAHIPPAPNYTYRDKGWVNWGDWLGTFTEANQCRTYRSFDECRRYARSLKLKYVREWFKFYKGDLLQLGKPPKDVPLYPHRVFKNKGWKGYVDWLGINKEERQKFMPFDEAKNFARKLNLKSCAEWKKYCKGEINDKPALPNNMPKWPGGTYKGKGWVSWGDWLGTGNIRPGSKWKKAIKNIKV